MSAVCAPAARPSASTTSLSPFASRTTRGAPPSTATASRLTPVVADTRIASDGASKPTRSVTPG